VLIDVLVGRRPVREYILQLNRPRQLIKTGGKRRDVTPVFEVVDQKS
jgi:hypothetical protein